MGSAEPHFPLGAETAPLTLLTGPPISPGSQTVGQGGKRPETRALLTGRSPSAVPARAPKVPAMVLCDRSPGSGEAPLPRAPFSCPAPPFSPPLLMMPRLSSPGAAAQKEGAVRQQLPHPEHRGKPAPGGRSPQHSVPPPIPLPRPGRKNLTDQLFSPSSCFSASCRDDCDGHSSAPGSWLRPAGPWTLLSP